VLVACWSVKGGSGTTTVAASLALVLARSSPAGALLVDAAGDLPTVLGVDHPPGPGVADWLAAGDGVPDDALARLATECAPGLRLIGWEEGGSGSGGTIPADAGRRLAAVLAEQPGPVVVDCGSAATPLAVTLAASATVSLLVLRRCFLALRRAVAAPVRPSGVVVVDEPGRVVDVAQIGDVLGVPVRAVVPWDRDIARAVDAGLLATRLPRVLARPLRAAA
jgi:MinD-like ATPase involved in chromosome partitioning or flagellar assembly